MDSTTAVQNTKGRQSPNSERPCRPGHPGLIQDRHDRENPRVVKRVEVIEVSIRALQWIDERRSPFTTAEFQHAMEISNPKAESWMTCLRKFGIVRTQHLYSGRWLWIKEAQWDQHRRK